MPEQKRAGDNVFSNSGLKNLRPVKIQSFGGCRVVHVGKMEIWDGAEFALIRETLRRLVEDEACRSLAVDMTYVKYVPSGFFGLLYDWFEKGVCVRVLAPLPHVKQMLWFVKFFHGVADGFFEMGPCLEDEFAEPDTECEGLKEPTPEVDEPTGGTLALGFFQSSHVGPQDDCESESDW